MTMKITPHDSTLLMILGLVLAMIINIAFVQRLSSGTGMEPLTIVALFVLPLFLISRALKNI